MPSKFGGLAVESRFGGIPVEEPESEGPSVAGALEPVATVLSGAIAEPLAGLAGIGAALVPGGNTGGEMVEDVRGALTYEPRTPEGRGNLIALGNLLAPIANLLQKAEQTSGDVGYDIAGPVGGALGASLPTAVAEILGLKGTRSFRRIANTPITPEASTVLEAGRRLNVPVLTTDVVEPTTFAGRFAQGLSEKLGPLGSGSARATQQQSRMAVLEGLADEFEIEMDSDFGARMVRSVNERSAQVLREAGDQRTRAVESLNRFGEVPLPRTIAAIEEQLARQARLGEKADAGLVDNLRRIRSSVEGGDFALVKDIRTEVISDLRAISRGDDTRAAASIQDVKSAIDQDMMQFARTHDRNAARDWIRSNRAFANELSGARDTELRNIFNRGDATPEVVMPILRNGRRSELSRLKNALTPNGRSAARAAIIQDALRESGFFSGNVNPDRFATAMLKPNRQQAIDVFFTDVDRQQIEGLTRLLDATRRAQQAAANPATGMQSVPFLTAGGIGFGMKAAPLETIATIGTLSAFAKAYESGPMRSLLLKIANSSAGSPQEIGLLESAAPALAGALQAATEPQEQRSQ